MKKTFKRTCAAALALTATAGITGIDKLVEANKNVVFADSQVTKPATQTEVNVLKISNYQKDVVMGSPFEMPTATFGGTPIEKCTVIAPSGTKTELTTNVDKEYKFDNIIVNEIGTYTISYTDASGKFSGNVTFRSTQSTTNTISLNTNNKYILPEVVGKEDVLPEVKLNPEDQTNTKKMYLPTYVVKNQKGAKVSDANVVISVKDPNFKPVDVKKDVDGLDYVDFGTDGLVKGTYTVTYSVYAANGQFLASTKQEFKCVDGYAYDGKLVLSYTKEKPESLNIGKEVELPGVTAKIGTKNVPIYYNITVLKNGLPENAEKLVPESQKPYYPVLKGLKRCFLPH